MISIKNMKKSFGTNVVLDGVGLDIETGDIVAIIGPSGTGKSTFLRCINLLEKPDQGSIVIDNLKFDYAQYSNRDALELRKKTAMVFQSFNLFQKKDVLHNVVEGLTVVQKIPKEQAREIAIDKLRKVHMDDKLDYYPKHLSGGMQQRVAIARAIALNPQLLLLDEPTSALDPELVNEVLETIQQLAEEKNTMIIVSHEMSFVRNVATKVIFMENGKIVEQGAPKKIFENPDNERTKEFLLKNRISIMPEYVI